MEEMEYLFINLTLPNIQSKLHKTQEKPESIRIERIIRPFVLELATKYPQWRFVSRRHTRHIDQETDKEYYEAYGFEIYSGKECLGEINTDNGRNGYKVFTMSNERISKIRERGSCTKTKDLNKALKIFSKMFGAKTLHERIDEVLTDVPTVVVGVTTDRYHKFSKIYEKIAIGLRQHIVENLDTLAATALATGVPKEAIEALPDVYAEYKITEEICSCLQKNLGSVVLIHGNDYAVFNIDTLNRETKLYSTDTLPPHIKRGVGMLKLVEDKHFIAKVGVKLSSVSFFIIPEEATNG